MNIATDLDGVAFPTPNLIFSWWNRAFRQNHKLSDFPDLFPYELYGVKKDDLKAELLRFFQSEQFRNMAPLEGAVDGLRTLVARGHTVCAITKKPSEIEAETIHGVREHFGDLIKEVFFPREIEGVGKETKAQVAQRVGARVLIDDYLPNLDGCPEYGVRGMLFDYNLGYGWCKREIPAWIGLARNWREVVDKIEAIAS